MKSVDELKKGDILTNTNHGFSIEIVEIGKKNTRYINLETGEKQKSFTSKFNFMLRTGVFVNENDSSLDSEIKSNFTEKMNIKFGTVKNAYVMGRVNMGFAPYETLCLICAELDIKLNNVSDHAFDSAVEVLKDFVSSANEKTGYTVSVWFDK